MKILIRRKIKGRDISIGMKTIKKKYPFAGLINYKFDEDFRFVSNEERNYETRTMMIVFVDDKRIK